MMLRAFLIPALLLGAFGASTAQPAAPVLLRPAIEAFITLPADFVHPEGLASNPANGDVYVGSFDAREPASKRNNQVLRYSATGKLLGRNRFGPQPLTGLAFAGGKLYVLNFGASKLQRLEANFNEASVPEDIVQFGPLTPAAPAARTVTNPDGSQDLIQFGAKGFPAINGMVFDAKGALYVSDSFQGAIYRIADAAHCKPCEVETISRDPLLATASGHLPFGANGLAFGEDPGWLYIANAGDGRLLRMSLASRELQVVAESLPGADGLMFHSGLFWVTANQADVVAGVDAQGLTRVRAGEFRGIAKDSTPRGLLFPASTTVSGPWMVVSNLALPLTSRVGDEWEERVSRWNLVRFRLP
jgi:sugar lactone lactonase YvrE